MTKKSGRKKALVAGGVIGAGIAAFFLLQRGGYFGTGSTEDSSALAVKDGSSPPAVPCKLRVGRGGITLDDKPTTIESAVKACKARGAELLVTGAAKHTQASQLEVALKAAGVKTLLMSSQPTSKTSKDTPTNGS